MNRVRLLQIIVCLFWTCTTAWASQKSVAEFMVDSVMQSMPEPSAATVSPAQTVFALEHQASVDLDLVLPSELAQRLDADQQLDSDQKLEAAQQLHVDLQDLDTTQKTTPNGEAVEWLPSWESWTSPERLTGTIRVVCVMAALSLAPALLLMTTCYVRLIVVLSLLRQALGSQQLPPNQVTTTLAMFLTALIMWPVWSKVHKDAIEPYTNSEVAMSAEEAWSAGVAPIREFMSAQISLAGNQADVKLFLDYLGNTEASTFADVPLQALLPAFLISELKVAFLIGFLVFLPFVIIDLVVASVTMSMGWMMVPPTTISLPLKLMLFVLVDGWHYVVQMLLMSFQIGG